MRQGAREKRWEIPVRLSNGHVAISSPTAPRLSPSALRESGFTLLEMMIVMFLLVAVLGIVIPRVNIDDDLGSTGRKLIGTVRSLQGIAMSTQKPVKLYMDMDQNTYWAKTLEGKEERPLSDATWATLRSLPGAIRFADISAGSMKRQSGRIDFMLYPNGRIDSMILYLTDTGNNILGIAVESTTGAIRASDERIEPQRRQTIPDRVKTLLTPSTTIAAGGTPGSIRR